MTACKWLIPACLALVLAGCGETGSDTGPVDVVPVRGRIVYDGKPAVGVRVTLVPIDAPSPPRIPRYAHGITDDEGNFTLTTYVPDDGAAEGGYQVVLDGTRQNNAEKVDSEETGDADLFKGWFDAMHSTLNVRIEKGRLEIPPIRIPKITKPAGVSEGVPGRN
jgi:hypothetical protein